MTTLMNQTLPTIVGMGIVSRTTDTMFGRGRVKPRPGRKPTVKMFKGRAVHKGKRGGTYIIKKGRKIYL